MYDLYPSFDVGAGKIVTGFEALADLFTHSTRVVLDGYGGVFWDELRTGLEAVFQARGIRSAWVDVDDALLPADQLEALVAPFLGGDDPIFGTRFTGALADFFDPAKLEMLQPDSSAEISLICGCGAALAGWAGTLVYLDVPKNEIQFRTRAGRVGNLDSSTVRDAKTTYKRMYFVDWIALNQHKAQLLERIDVIVDAQRPSDPVAMRGADLRSALGMMTRNVFRARPWFEPGPWGGQWIKQRVAVLEYFLGNLRIAGGNLELDRDEPRLALDVLDQAEGDDVPRKTGVADLAEGFADEIRTHERRTLKRIRKGRNVYLQTPAHTVSLIVTGV